MADTTSTNQELEQKKKRQQAAQEIQRAANEWLAFNKRVLDAQVNFLKAVRDKRANLAAQNTNKIKETFLKNIYEFLSK